MTIALRRITADLTWEPWPGYGDSRVDYYIESIVDRHMTALSGELKQVAADVQFDWGRGTLDAIVALTQGGAE